MDRSAQLKSMAMMLNRLFFVFVLLTGLLWTPTGFAAIPGATVDQDAFSNQALSPRLASAPRPSPAIAIENLFNALSAGFIIDTTNGFNEKNLNEIKLIVKAEQKPSVKVDFSASGHTWTQTPKLVHTEGNRWEFFVTRVSPVRENPAGHKGYTAPFQKSVNGTLQTVYYQSEEHHVPILSSDFVRIQVLINGRMHSKTLGVVVAPHASSITPQAESLGRLQRFRRLLRRYLRSALNFIAGIHKQFVSLKGPHITAHVLDSKTVDEAKLDLFEFYVMAKEKPRAKVRFSASGHTWIQMPIATEISQGRWEFAVTRVPPGQSYVPVLPSDQVMLEVQADGRKYYRTLGSVIGPPKSKAPPLSKIVGTSA